MKSKNLRVGISEDGKPIINGREIFKIMDSRGVPLDMVCEILRAKGVGFDTVGFVEAALESGNYTYKTIRPKLLEACLPEYRDTVASVLDFAAAKKGWT